MKFESFTEALVVDSLFRAHGIPSHLLDYWFHTAYNRSFKKCVGDVHIMLPKKYVAEAKQLVGERVELSGDWEEFDFPKLTRRPQPYMATLVFFPLELPMLALIEVWALASQKQNASEFVRTFGQVIRQVGLILGLSATIMIVCALCVIPIEIVKARQLLNFYGKGEWTDYLFRY